MHCGYWEQPFEHSWKLCHSATVVKKDGITWLILPLQEFSFYLYARFTLWQARPLTNRCCIYFRLVHLLLFNKWPRTVERKEIFPFKNVERNHQLYVVGEKHTVNCLYQSSWMLFHCWHVATISVILMKAQWSTVPPQFLMFEDIEFEQNILMWKRRMEFVFWIFGRHFSRFEHELLLVE